MFCKNCGAPLVEGDVFCRSCGANINNSNNNQQGNISTNTVKSIRRKKKKSDIVTNIMIGCCALVVVASAVIIFVLVKNGTSSNIRFEGDYGDIPSNTDINNNEINNTSNGNLNLNINSNSNINTNTNVVYDSSSFAVKFKGFTFRIPNNIVYETRDDSILLQDSSGTWATYIEILDGSYDVVQTQKSELQAIYQNQGFTSNNLTEKNIDGINFITLEVSKSGNNALLGISGGDATHFFGTTVYDIENKFDYDILKTISKVLSSAVYSGDSNSISSFDNPDLSKISGLAS